MNSLVVGAKSSLISLLLVVVTFVTVFFLEPHWTVWLSSLSFVNPVLALITAALAIQFNQSRIVMLIAMLLLGQVLTKLDFSMVPLLISWQENSSWQLLSLVGFLSYLAFSKDYSLLSVPFILWLVFFAIAVLLASSWLALTDWLVFSYPQLKSYQLATALQIYLPISLAIISVGFACCLFSQLIQPAIFVTLLSVIALHFNFMPLPYAAMFFVLLCYFLLTVLISSYFLAYRDELTGLPSRRALFQTALSLSGKYAVAMMDIDHFKKFNDTYGHDVGDQVLKLVASKLKKVKSGGRVFRYGGEEFTVIFPRKIARQTLIELERLRQSVADYQMVIRQADGKNRSKENRHKIKKNQTCVSVTISIGVASRTSNENFEQVMKLADQKLYQAKKKGRNQVCH